MYYSRKLEVEIFDSLEINPVTAILGPRQSGKSTLAKFVGNELSRDFIYLDLERPSDLAKLHDSEWFLQSQKGKLICLDEIQRIPALFTVLRSLTDDWGGSGHFLVLCSASRDLLNQSAESLAGRISYKKLLPFSYIEVCDYFLYNNFLRVVVFLGVYLPGITKSQCSGGKILFQLSLNVTF